MLANNNRDYSYARNDGKFIHKRLLITRNTTDMLAMMEELSGKW